MTTAQQILDSPMSDRDSLAALPIAERVAAGIDFLDRKHPGWDERINLDNLWLENCSRCILGQLFGEYAYGKYELGIEFPDTARFGFDRDDTDPAVTYDELTTAWIDAIRSRRQAVAR